MYCNIIQELIQQFQTIMYVSETVPVTCAMTYEIDLLSLTLLWACYVIFLTLATNNALAKLNFTQARQNKQSVDCRI